MKHAVGATALYALLAFVLTAPALLGRAALGPDRILDWDPLFRTAAPPDLSEIKITDDTPAVLDFPRDLAFARGLQSGRLDAWNPLAGAGVPLWAEQGGPFFPLKLVFYLAPSHSTYQLFLSLRLVLAALGAYLLARHRGLPFLPAFAAGVTFELCGAVLTQLPFAAASPIFVLPWVVLGSFAIAARQTSRAAIGAGVALGVAASGGHPTLVLLVFLAFAAAAGGHAVASWRRPRAIARMAALGLLAGVVGLALAAPSLLPLAELANNGVTYKHSRKGEQIREWSIADSRRTAPGALLASAALHTMPEVKRLVDLSPSIGTLALFTALAGLAGTRIRPAFAIIATLGIALALVPPLLGRISELPGVRLILPAYAWPLFTLPLTQAVGDGVRALTGSRAGRLAALSLAMMVGVSVSLRLASDGRIDLPSMFPAAACATLCAVWAVARKSLGAAPISATLGAAVITLLMVFEQLLTMRPFILQPASTVLSSPPSPAVEFLRSRLANHDGRMVGVPYRVGYPVSPMLFGLPDLRGLSALPVRRHSEYLRAISRTSSVFTVQDVQVTKSPLLDLAAVRHVVLAQPYFPALTKEWLLITPFGDKGKTAAELPLVYRDERVLIYESPRALPRLRIVHRSKRAANEAEALRWATAFRLRNDPAADSRIADTVLLEPDGHGNPAPELSEEGSATESVRLIDGDDPDRLLLKARLDRAGFVVIADTYYPGWRAWIDGVAAPIHPANLLFRAVPAPPGEHEIELRYQPRSLRYGTLLAAAAAALCASMLVLRRAR